MNPIKRIKELCALGKQGKLTPEMEKELAELQAKFPKTGNGKRKSTDRKAGNDFAFWNDYPELMQAAAKVAYNRIPGVPVHVAPATAGTSSDFEPSYFLVCDYQAALGSSRNGTSAVNLAMRNLWLDMHRKYRGLGGYEYADLAITELAIIDVWGWIAEFERVYGLLNAYPVRNRTTPRKLLQAMGMADGAITFLAEHLAEFRYRLNRAIIKAERLCLPKGFKYLDNRIAMNAFVYADSKDTRASYIVFKQKHHWKYQVNTNLGGYLGVIVNSLYTSNSTPTMDTFFLDLEDCIDVLVTDTDVARICSDLLAAIGDNDIEVLKPMPEDYRVVATYNENMLLKLHNAEVYGTGTLSYLRTAFLTAADLTEFNGSGKLKPIAYQKDGVVISIPFKAQAAVTETAVNVAGFGYVPSNTITSMIQYGEWQQHYIDTWKDQPGVEDVCESSLWKTVRYVNPAYEFGALSCSTEVITCIHTFNYFGNQQVSTTHGSIYDDADPMLDLAMLTQIDWHPIIAIVTDNSGTSLDFAGILGDVDNLTWNLDAGTIAQIHDAALLSAFNIKLAVKG